VSLLNLIHNIHQTIKAMKKVSIALVILLGSMFNAKAQSGLPKFAPSPDKIKVKLDMPLEGRAYKNGTGYTLNPKMLKELPKKVALVSFYTFDPGFTQTWSSSSTTNGYYTSTKTTTTTTKKRNTKGNAGFISGGMYYSAIEVLKSKYKEMGMELLEPEEFLDTDEKRTFYESYQVERSKFNSTVQSMLNSGRGHEAVYAYPEGYKVIPTTDEPYANYTKKGLFPIYKAEVADGQLWVMSKVGKEITSINRLTKALGVDAVVFFYSTIYTPKEGEIYLQNVNMQMFGPNPIPLPEGKTSKFNYFPGQMYIGTRVTVKVPIQKIHKKKPETNQIDLAGYSNIVEAMTIRMKEYFDKAFAKR
jgi:hypothetical protein